MSESSILAVKSAADALGVTFQRPQYAEELAQDAEFRVTQLLKSITLLKKKTHSQKLTCQHVSTILKYFREEPLLGYAPDSEYNIKENSTDGIVFRYIADDKAQLSDIIKKPIPPGRRQVPFEFQWKVVNGVKFDSLPAKGRPKGITNISQAAASMNSNYDVHQEASVPPLSEDLATFYAEATNLIEENIEMFYPSLFETLQQSVGIGPTIPNFLCFFYAQIAQYLDDYVRMSAVARAALSLVENKTLPINLFAHSFMKIGFTLIHKKTATGTPDQDCDIRRIGGDIIISLASSCSSGYPGIRSEVISQLSNTLFNNMKDFSIVFGSVYTLINMDDESFVSAVPHIRLVYKNARNRPGNDYAVNTTLCIEKRVYLYVESHQRIDPSLSNALCSLCD
jgi:transcription initiation factor TFIID subunit 6